MEPPLRQSFARAVLVTGILAGSLDILAAFTHAYLAGGTTPVIVLKYISSAVLGSDAFSGGTGVVFMGLIIHYLIALSWTLIFFLIYPKLPFLSKNPVLTGAIYGIFVWAMMGFVILPFTAVPKSQFNVSSALVGATILVLMIGMPNAFGARSFYRVHR
ncbi:MAG: hypothetical protein WKF87_03090 [Chryseolinea sp.]